MSATALHLPQLVLFCFHFLYILRYPPVNGVATALISISYWSLALNKRIRVDRGECLCHR